MRSKMLGNLGLVVLVVLSILALKAQKPVAFLVLRDADSPEAFRVEVGLGSGAAHVEPLGLNPEQRKTAMTILKDQDAGRLSHWAKDLGAFHAVVGLPGIEEAWPSFWDRGAKPRDAENEFNDLTWIDRSYLSLGPYPNSPTSGMVPNVALPVTSEIKKTPVPAATTPVPALLLVEIQNGCGITGAAEWVARRLGDAHVRIVRTGNADHFRHPQTYLKTNLASSVALEDVLDRLALDRSRVQAMTPALPGVDAVIVVGRDFVKLKEKWRERDRNGTQ